MPAVHGADPTRVVDGGVSTLDAAAREGQVEIARLLLRRAPELATEERALLAADHPATEALIRAVARGEPGGTGHSWSSACSGPSPPAADRPATATGWSSTTAEPSRWAGALAAARPWGGEPLHEIDHPRVGLTGE